MKIIERLYQYIEIKKIKPTVFERELGFSSGYLSNQRKRNADIGESALIKIIDYCHDLSPVWLVLGKGDMIKENESDDDDEVYKVLVKSEISGVVDINDVLVIIANRDRQVDKSQKQVDKILEQNDRLISIVERAFK